MSMAEVLQDVARERAAQDAKWGEQNWPDGTGHGAQPLVDFTSDASTASVLAALATENTDEHAGSGAVTYTDILLEEVFEALAEDDPVKLRVELVQVAAVAVQWVEAIDRRETYRREFLGEWTASNDVPNLALTPDEPDPAA